jgi:hypothetical protein
MRWVLFMDEPLLKEKLAGIVKEIRLKQGFKEG